MRRIDRRKLLSGLAVVGSAVAATPAAAEQGIIELQDLRKDTEVACVYHCDFADPRRLNQMAGNINNHLSVYDFDPFKLKIVLVAHGVGIKPFLVDLQGTPWSAETVDAAVFERFASLSKYGVEVYLCRITFRNNKIDLAKARTESWIKLVPSGVATVAELQRRGFAYLKVG